MSSASIPRQLPTSVRRASQLVAGCAILSAVGAGVAITALHHLNTASAVYLRVVSDVDHAHAVTGVANLRSDLLVHAVVGIAGVLTLAPLSVALRRPWRIARFGAWISALILSLGLALVVAGSPENTAMPDGLGAPEVSTALDGLLVGWYPALTSVLGAAQFVVTVAFSILLLRTTSGEFYAGQGEGPAGLWTFVPRSDSGSPRL